MLPPVARNTAVTLAIGATLALALACGSADSGPDSSSDAGLRDAAGKSGLTANRLIANPAGNYTIDDLAAVGFKKSRQFDTATVPEALDIWYGFFNQKDIEVRVYADHQHALDYGVAPAEEVIAKDPGQTDYLIPVVNRYPAYVVYGNLVMLCERELGTCQSLIEELE